MKLPQPYLNRMKERLGEEFPAFLRSYEGEPCRGIRINPFKISRGEWVKRAPFPIEEVPWEENGFYTEAEKAGADVYHFAGLYYSQEPSAMSAVPLFEAAPGERVLDLCAAPGGKCTQLAAYMKNEGVLIANEYIPSRAKILEENTVRLGLRNCAVVSAAPAVLAKLLPSWFDKILVDAPCSGEGMFKKEPSAVQEWSEENVMRSARRQREILESAAQMLAVGGRMIYSTCTFSKEEDEEQIASFLARHTEFSLVKEQKMYPHKVRGEGHYCALMEKREGERSRLKPFPVHHNKAALTAFSAFSEDFFQEGRVPCGEITTLADGRLFLIPEGLPSLNVHVLRAGVELGEWNGKLFKPAHALAAAMRREEAKRYVSLTREEAKRYLRGEALSVSAPCGWCLVGVEEFPLGLGKVTDGILKNHYPKELRMYSGR